MASVLNKIKKANDIKSIPQEEYPQLAKELRQFLVESVSQTGGHLASNLGAVELTMALHLFLDFPQDKLIFDVGHQSYVHKILSGRRESFSTLRQFAGISGFPKPKESETDAFLTGHSSTSISAALGLVNARELRQTKEKIVAVIGDGALSGGMAFEALNNAGRLKSNLIIVLNDNDMSISENVGAMANYLGKIRTSQTYGKIKDEIENFLNRVTRSDKVSKAFKRTKASIKQLFLNGMLFENMGITYVGPIDGHNIERMTDAFSLASQAENATLVHVVTKKGKGYLPAEQNPIQFHGIGKFDPKTGKPCSEVTENSLSFTDYFSKAILELAKNDSSICAITAAMKAGTGLTNFAKRYPKRFFDVGIAEEHAVTFAAGLATGGLRPIVAIYSTFLQRAYDQILHDVCLPQLPVVFAVDRNGIVGQDGETHQGIFTHSFLGHIPGLLVLEPADGEELFSMLSYALSMHGPACICYPRAQTAEKLFSSYTELRTGRAVRIVSNQANDATTQFDTDAQEENIETKKSFHMCYHEEELDKNQIPSLDCVLLALGSTLLLALSVQKKLEEKGITSQVVNMRFVSPMDKEAVQSYAKKAKLLVTMEENVRHGGFGEQVSAILCEMSCTSSFTIARLLPIALENEFLQQGTRQELLEYAGMDEACVTERIIKEL